MLKEIITLGIILNIVGFFTYVFLIIYYYIANKNNVRELVLKNKQIKSSTIKDLLFIISFALPYYVFLKSIIVVYIIRSNKSLEEKEVLINKLKIFRENNK